MSGRLTVACVQVSATREIEPNLAALAPLIRRSRDAGAQFIVTPENVALLEPQRVAKLEKAEDEASPIIVPFFAEMAQETEAWILAGSIACRIPGEERLANRSFLFDPQGQVAATYDKIHMFDVDLAGGESYRESNQFRPGDKTVVAETPWGGVGLSICYDLRFGALYRLLAQAGAIMLTVPSAFTVPTGQAHWHTLLRARAIENGCFVLAPAQTGTHAEGRKTFGHSLIVSPWGEVLTDGGADVGFVTAELDLARIEEARSMVPSLRHDRPLPAPEIAGILNPSTLIKARIA